MSEQQKRPAGPAKMGRYLASKGTAPATPAESDDVSQTPQVAPPPPPARPAGRARREAKFAATYRMPERALDLIDAAKAEAEESGQRLTKEEAVAYAIELAYGHLIPTS